MCIYIHAIYIYMYVYIYICMSVYVYVYIYICTYSIIPSKRAGPNQKGTTTFEASGGKARLFECPLRPLFLGLATFGEPLSSRRRERDSA